MFTFDEVITKPIPSPFGSMTFDAMIEAFDGPKGEPVPLPQAEHAQSKADEIAAVQAFHGFLKEHAFREMVDVEAPFRNNCETSSIDAFLEWCALAKDSVAIDDGSRFSLMDADVARNVGVLGHLVMEFGRGRVDGEVDRYVVLRSDRNSARQRHHEAHRALRDAIKAGCEGKTHLASVFLAGVVAGSVFSEIAERDADPDAYYQGREDSCEAGYGCGPEASVEQIADILRAHSRRSDLGREFFDDEMVRSRKLGDMDVSRDPISDLRIMMPRGDAMATNAVEALRTLAGRYGGSTTVDEFVASFEAAA